jgi:hypothetical protein
VWHSAALAVCIMLAACSSGDDLEKQLDTVASWTATMQLAATEHRSRAVTTTYATQLTDAAGKVLADAHQTLSRVPHGESDDRHARATLDSLEHAIHDLETEARR